MKLNFDRNLFLDFHRRVLFCKKLTVVQMHEYCLGMAFDSSFTVIFSLRRKTARWVTWKSASDREA